MLSQDYEKIGVGIGIEYIGYRIEGVDPDSDSDPDADEIPITSFQ